MKYRFSGHETFHCRPIWLKKGYDFIQDNNQFHEDNAVTKLGVGKNMVASIKFWLKSFSLYDPNQNALETIADDLLGDQGFDPFIENDATLYLLHYFLVQNIETSSIYNLVFLKFSKEKTEFTHENLVSFIKRECLKTETTVTKKTLDNDIKVLIKNYIVSKDKNIAIEDNFNGLFHDFDFIQKIDSENGETKYRFNINSGKNIPEDLFLYIILLVFKDQISIDFETIRQKVSSVFLIEKQGTYDIIEKLALKHSNSITFNDDAGRQELQFKKEIDKSQLLRNYYEGI